MPFLAFQSAGNDYRDLDGGNLGFDRLTSFLFGCFVKQKPKKQKNCRVHEEYHC